VTDDIVVSLTHVPERTVRGAFVVPALEVRNTGADPVTVSSRLNLFEGDVVVRCTPPDGDRVELRGAIEVDSLPRTVELGPGQRLESGLFLSYASVGVPFETLGTYELVGAYRPGPAHPTVTSDPVVLQVVEPTSDEERQLAALTLDGNLARTVALCGLETDPQAVETLETLAERFPNRPEGSIARLVLASLREADAGVVESVVEAWGVTTTAHWITALLPGGDTAESVRREYLELLERAKRIAREEPYG
jgi:hypothetical protein